MRPYLKGVCVALGTMLAPAVFPCTQAPPAQMSASQSRVRPYSTERTEQWTLQSAAGRTFEISVSYPKQPAPANGYPVIYVLDAARAFATLADTVRNHEILFGPVVVVGVGYPSDAEAAKQIFDMSPATDPATLPAFFPEGWGAVGGADAFLAFLQNDLRAAIEKRVPADKTRQALLGHSLSGLFVLHVLFTHPEAFDTYVAGSPTIWWGEKLILKELAAFEASMSSSGARRRLLITVGGLEGGMSVEEKRAAAAMKLIRPEEMLRNANMIGNARSLVAQLQRLPAHGLRVTFAELPDETHNSVIPAYLGRGTRFTLSAWFD